MIKVLSVLLFLSLKICATNAQQVDENVIVFWNLENFYDYTDGGTGESDAEFSPYGKRYWTSRRFYDKSRLIAKSIFWIGDWCGRIPDVIGVAEVENRSVLSRLLSSTGLRKHDYKVVHQDSGDRRGIDVALMYRSDAFEMIDRSFVTPLRHGIKMQTRDILCVKLRRLSDGRVFDFIVNHHPSKFSGSAESEESRETVMKSLCSVCDSLNAVSSCIDAYGGIIAMGDFNDTPDSPPFRLIEGLMVNKGVQLHDQGRGTIRYEGKWELIDMFLVSASLADISVMEIVNIPFLMVKDNGHAGLKPLRTYSGPKYLGGVSDHCPIILKIN